jgi:small subunit ribosomal protein S8
LICAEYVSETGRLRVRFRALSKRVGKQKGFESMMTDPIADMLTRIRNASKAKHEKVDIPSSKLKVEIAKILKDEGFVKNVKLVKDRRQGHIRVYLKYTEDEAPVLQGLKRISRPGCRVYASNDTIPKVLDGLGTAILSTPKGIQTGKQAKKDNVGGEVLCHVW